MILWLFPALLSGVPWTVFFFIDRKKPLYLIFGAASVLLTFCVAVFRGVSLLSDVFGILLFSLLSWLSAEDLRDQTIPVWPVPLLLAASIAYRLSLGAPFLPDIAVSFGLGLFIFGMTYLLSRSKGMGAGDVLVFPAVCASLHPVSVPILLSISALSAIPGAFLLNRKTGGKLSVPLVPFIQFGLSVMLLLEPVLLPRWFLIPVTL